MSHHFDQLDSAWPGQEIFVLEFNTDRHSEIISRKKVFMLIQSSCHKSLYKLYQIMKHKQHCLLFDHITVFLILLRKKTACIPSCFNLDNWETTDRIGR